MSPATEDAIVTLLGIAVTLLAGGLGLLVRITAKWAKSEAKIAEIAGDLADASVRNDRTHREIVDQMRDDRRATNERLTWLERNLWQRGA